MKSFMATLLALILGIGTFAQQVVYPPPSQNQIAGQTNRLCQDGWYSHDPNNQGACSYHGGFFVEGGESCDSKCQEGVAIGVGAAALAVGIIIAVERHKAHIREVRSECQAYPNNYVDKQGRLYSGRTDQPKKTELCSQWLEHHKEKGKK